MNSTPFGRGGPNPVIRNRLGRLENYIEIGFVLADSSKPLRACLNIYRMEICTPYNLKINK